MTLPSLTQAYEADIHYSTTYVLARAVGWSDADARTIASANQGVDENPETVAALEVESTLTGSLHQAEKNLRFHCFSRTGGQAGRISADVREVIAGHFAEVPQGADDPRGNARRLIALGAALHCQQDAYSHEGFGGSCGPYPGSCYGHTYQTFLDQVVFRVLGKHHYNPDHPGVSGERLLEALQGSARALSTHRAAESSRPIPYDELVALSEALRSSGLELPDEVRIECNRYVAGKWLYDFLRPETRTPGRPGALETLSPEVAGTCGNASLESATIVRIPDARFPRLKADASPLLVRADGSYQLVRDGEFAVASPAVHTAAIGGHMPGYDARKVKLQLSHWSQLLALPLVTRMARLSADSKAR